MKRILFCIFLLVCSQGISQNLVEREEWLSKNRAISYIDDLIIDRQFKTEVDSSFVIIKIKRKEDSIDGFNLDHEIRYNTGYRWKWYDSWKNILWEESIITLYEVRYEKARYFNNELELTVLVFIRI